MQRGVFPEQAHSQESHMTTLRNIHGSGVVSSEQLGIVDKTKTTTTNSHVVSIHDGVVYYVPEQIHCWRKSGSGGGSSQYLVKWKGYPESDNTWEPMENIHSPELIKAFHKRYGLPMPSDARLTEARFDSAAEMKIITLGNAELL